MARFTIITLLLFLIGTGIAWYAPNNLFAILQGIGFVGLLASAVYYTYRIVRRLQRWILWKVRNKIIISFAFVGVIPVVILALIAFLSMTLIFRQLSVLYLQNELEQLVDTLHNTGEQVVLRYYQGQERGEERLRELLQQEQEALAQLHPRLSNTRFRLLRRQARRSETLYDLRFEVPAQPDSDETAVVPFWAGDGFQGLASSVGRLFVKSLLPVRSGNQDYLVYIDLPVDEKLGEHIYEATSIEMEVLRSSAEGGPVVDSQVQEFLSATQGLFQIGWGHVLTPVNWDNQVNSVRGKHGVVIRVHLANLFDRFFIEGEGFGPFIVGGLLALVIAFFLVELGSLLIGIAIARSITRSIHNLYAGTRHIQLGNFDFRIPAGDRDQLDAMATAFNKMSESVVGLMSQISDKERLEKELEIAREVQTHLFPRELPGISQMELAGTCLPARTVSGDYYDFIPYGGRALDVIIADISGKGISAALLMANLQSSIRTHVAYQLATSNGEHPIAEAVAAINRQLYTHTSPDKFATLVLARFNTEKMLLSYCNAGHNPPLLISDGAVRKLSTGGIVAGLFDEPAYDEEHVNLNSGDLVVFYTDGVVEAENPDGEEFEESRLENLLVSNSFLTADDIRKLIIEEVTTWVDGREQRDDITVVVLKVAGDDRPSSQG